jgi:hypothetical protein
VSVSSIVIVVMTILLLNVLKRTQPQKKISIVITQATVWLQLTTLAVVFVFLMLHGKFFFIR